MGKIRKVPERMCLGCRTKRPKRELVRVVRTPQGEVLVDPTGKRAGRGAYVCPAEACLKKAVKARSLERALAVPIGEDLLAELAEQVRQREETGNGGE